MPYLVRGAATFFPPEAVSDVHAPRRLDVGGVGGRTDAHLLHSPPDTRREVRCGDAVVTERERVETDPRGGDIGVQVPRSDPAGVLFFNHLEPPGIHTLSLHDALPI